MTTFGPPRRLAAALLALGLCTTGPACDKGGTSDEQSLLELRPVLAANPPPCPTKAPKKGELVLPRNADGKVAECLELGQPIVDAGDVRSATGGPDPGRRAGAVGRARRGRSANLDGFAQRNLGKRLAIVADGNLVSAPTVQYTSFAGRVQVTGLPKEKTDDLFRRLNELIHPG